MSSPVSTSVSLGSGLILVEDALEGAVLCGVVGGVGLPALPDRRARRGRDADGVGVVVFSGSGSGRRRPRVGLPGAGGEVAYGVAELFVSGPAVADGADFAGLSGYR